MFTGTVKDIVTNIAGLVLVIVSAIQQALAAYNGQDVNWYQIVATVVVAVIAYFTGKTGDGKAKVTA
jgi:hypothetical protein